MILLESLVAALVGLAVVALIIGPLASRSSAPAPVAEEPDDLEDTPKGVALSALREIEFDKATGKLSEEDYAALKAKYTAEALAVLRSETASEAAHREESVREPAGADLPVPSASLTGEDPVEALVAERLRQMQSGVARCPDCGPRPEGDALYCSTCGRSLSVGGCADCGAPLVPGSRFCENCGVPVGK